MYCQAALALIISLALRNHLASSQSIENEKKLYNDLLKSYDKRVIPKGPTKDPLLVIFNAGIMQILDVNMKGQIFDGVYYVYEVWTDRELTWNPADYGGIQSLAIPEDTIWEPTIRLYNNVDFAVSKNSEMTTFITVWHNGSVTRSYIVRIKSSCSMGLRYFPFDRQNCTLTFTQLRHTSQQLNITNSYEMELDYFSESSSYRIIEPELETWTEVRFNGEEPLVTFIHYNIVFQRRPLSYLLNLVLPCSLTTFVALLSFCLPPDSGEKVGLGVTVLLSLSVFLIIVSENLPQTTELPLIGIFFFGVFLLVTLTTSLSILTMSLHYKSTSDNVREMPRWMQVILFEYVARWLCMTSIITQQNPTREDLNGFEVKTDKAVANKINRVHVAPYESKAEEDNKHTEQAVLTTEANEDIRVISNFVRSLESSNAAEERERKKSVKWRNSALVLDRILFIILALTTIIFTLWILLEAAHG